jgi:hypothetical protein
MAVAAAARRLQWQRQQLGHGGQLDSGSGSLVAAQLQRRQLGGNTSAVAAAAAQWLQRQFCSDGQLGGGGGSLAAAAWRQRGCSSRLLLVDCCLLGKLLENLHKTKQFISGTPR